MKVDEILKDLLFMALVIVGLSFAGYALAEDIDYTEIRPDIIKIKVDTIKILNFSETAVITLRYVNADGNSIKEERVIFMNREDNLETPEDETSTEYTDLMQGLGVNKTFLKQALQFKLGL